MTEAMVEQGGFQALVEKARAGDRRAFEEIVRAAEARLRSSVERRLGPAGRAADADEVVQETFALAFEAIGRLDWRGEAAFFAWLSRIARNVLIDRARDSRRRRYLEIPERLPAREPSPSGALRREERFDRLEQAFAALPPDYRRVLRLSQIERLKVKEIARRMGRSEDAVKHLMARAIRKLRAAFGRTESLVLPPRSLEEEGGGRGEG